MADSSDTPVEDHASLVVPGLEEDTIAMSSQEINDLISDVLNDSPRGNIDLEDNEIQDLLDCISDKEGTATNNDLPPLEEVPKGESISESISDSSDENIPIPKKEAWAPPPPAKKRNSPLTMPAKRKHDKRPAPPPRNPRVTLSRHERLNKGKQMTESAKRMHSNFDIAPGIPHLSGLRTKERSLSLPAFDTSADAKNELEHILSSSSTIFSFTEHMKEEEKNAVDFWVDTSRFLEYATCTDPLVANNMAQNMCLSYKTKEGLSSSLRDLLEEYSKGKFGDLPTNIHFVKECQQKIFMDILTFLLPKYGEYTLSPPTATPRFGSASEDPFSNLTESSIRIKSTPDGDIIISASVARIVFLLTGDVCDHEFSYALITTVDYYSKYEEFFDLLQKRLQSVVSTNTEKAPITIKTTLRIVNLLKLFIEQHIQEVQAKPSVAKLIREFAEKHVKEILPSAQKNLTNFLDTKCAAIVLETEEKSAFQFSEKFPRVKKASSLKGKTLEQITLEDIHPLEFARQLALVDHLLYRSINPSEVLHMRWTKKKTKKQNSPNVLKMIEQFNHVGQWVISTILTQHDSSKRVKILQKMIKIAHHSYMLKNFNGAMAMISGLRNSNVIRLKTTWNLLPSSCWDLWEEITDTFILNDNFASLRGVLQETTPPLIPYLGIYLSDLTFTEGQPSEIDSLVNVVKLQKIATVLSDMKQGQTTPYCLANVPLIQEFLTNLSFIPESEYAKNKAACNESSEITSRESRGSVQIDESMMAEARKPKRTKSFLNFHKLAKGKQEQ